MGDGQPDWLAFAVAGATGSLALGLLVGNGAMALIPGLYGLMFPMLDRAAVGWGLHLLHGSAFAVLFGLGLERLWGPAGSVPTWKLATAGVAFAGALWVFGWSIVGPRLLEAAIGFGDGGPSWDGVALVGHLVYGLAVGPGALALGQLREDRSASGVGEG